MPYTKGAPGVSRNRGERNPRAKLTRRQVLVIRDKTIEPITLCERFGITRATVSRIRSGQQWRHV